eukprot:6177586-Pleurochrysis_carterae.AAC.1
MPGRSVAMQILNPVRAADGRTMRSKTALWSTSSSAGIETMNATVHRQAPWEVQPCFRSALSIAETRVPSSRWNLSPSVARSARHFSIC